MKLKRNMIRITAMMLLGTTIFSAACKKSEITPVNATNKIVYIYKADNTDGLAFKALLEANNSQVTLIDKSVAATTDFSSYQLIVLGSNTDISQPIPDWSAADSAAINGSGKPILLIGGGGMTFAQRIKNKVNRGSCASGDSSTFFHVTDPSATIYTSPKKISLPVNDQLGIYTTPIRVESYYAATLPIAGIEMIGEADDFLPYHYFSVSYEKGRYGNFGFCGNFNSMTASGKDFLVNLSFYVGHLSL